MKAQSNDINDYPDADLLYPGNYLKSAEIKLLTKPTPLTIQSIEPRQELRRQGEKNKSYKPAIFFRETEKGFVCNKTNAKRLVECFGKDPRKWIGKRVVFGVEVVESFGKMVDAIRVNVDATRKANAAANRAVTQENVAAINDSFADDERALADAAAEAERAAKEQAGHI